MNPTGSGTTAGSTCPSADKRQPVRVELWNEDCIAGMAERIQSSSVNLTVTSIPFEEL